MRTVFRIIFGLVIGTVPWIPAILADPYPIPFQKILGVAGTLAGTVIIVVAVVKWKRRNSRR